MIGTTQLPIHSTRRISRLPSWALSLRKRPAEYNEQSGSTSGFEDVDYLATLSQIRENVRRFEYELGKSIFRTAMEAEEGSSTSSSPEVLTPLLNAHFQILANTWKEATRYLSNQKQKCSHPAYQEIIKMGRSALPFILSDLKESMSDWFWALTAITGENPIPEHDWGKVPAMTEAWLQWGSAKGYNI